jgi:hypothetical protein
MNFMKRLLPFFGLLSSLLFMSGCALVHSGPTSEVLLQLGDISTGSYSTRPVVVEMDDKPVVLHANKEGRVTIQIGEKRQLLDQTARVKEGASFFQLQRNGKELDALWWSHKDGKNVYFTSSVDNGQQFTPVSMVNDDHGVLSPLTLTRGPQGVIGLTYHDERQPNYQAYFNRSTDYGRTWANPDQRLDTPPEAGRSSMVFEPQSVEVGPVWLGAWTDNVQIAGKQTYRIVSRRSLDAGVSWAPPEVLFSSDHHVSSLIVRAQGDSIVVAADELERGVFALVSNDQGMTWSNAGPVLESDHASNSGILMTLAGGRAHMVWMQERTSEKLKIMRASLDVTQHQWLGTSQRLNLKAYENTRASNPALLATSQGFLITAWVDYRDIRPNIYLSVSSDDGQTWSAPQPLLKPGEVSAGSPQLIRWRDQAAIAYEVYPTERPSDGQFIVRLLTAGNSLTGLDGLAMPMNISEVDRKSKLEQRVKKLWDARLSLDHDTSYEMFDFAYKASNPKKSYTDYMGIITYLAYNVEEISIAGNEAAVKMKIKYEVKPTIMPTAPKPISIPPTESESPSTWVWVGNDWYLVYAPAYESAVLKY